jgi:hypothetical protein
VQFGRLERVEIGGTKGKALTSAIKQIHADFLAAHARFQLVCVCICVCVCVLGGGACARVAVVQSAASKGPP